MLYLLGRPKSVERLRRGRDIVKYNRALPAAGERPVEPVAPAQAGPRSTPPRVAPPATDTTPPKAPVGFEPPPDVELAGSDWTDDEPEDT